MKKYQFTFLELEDWLKHMSWFVDSVAKDQQEHILSLINADLDLIQLKQN